MVDQTPSTAPPGVDPELLAREADFVRRLAVRLASPADPASDADDLAQDTLERALARGDRMGRAPRPWLALVMTRLARNRFRAASRRRQHETAAAESAQDGAAPYLSPPALLVREEVRTRIVAALEELDEPYRGTLLARYHDGTATNEIARRDGIDPATVRSRIRRGLETLRARLDRDFGERSAWASLWFVPVPTAAVAVPSAAWKAAVSAFLVAMISTGGAAMLWPDDGSEGQKPGFRHTPETARLIPDQSPGGLPEKASGEESLARQPLQTGTALPPRPDYPHLERPRPVRHRIRVVDQQSGAPVAGARVRALAWLPNSNHPDLFGDSRFYGLEATRNFGTVYRTNAEGMADVFVFPGGRVLASLGSQHAEGRVHRALGMVTRLVLGSTLLYQTRVVDANLRGLSGMRIAGLDVVSDEQGLVSHFASAHKTPPRIGLQSLDAEWLTMSADPTYIPTLAAPAFGRMRVSLFTRDGSPLPTHPTQGEWHIVSTTDGRTLEDRNLFAKNGSLLFPQVPLGHQFRLSWQERGLQLHQTFAGPDSSDPDQHVKLTVNEDLLVVHARLQDTERRDLSGYQARITFDGSGESINHIVDRDNRVSWWLLADDGHESGKLRIHHQSGSSLGLASWTLPRRQRPTDSDAVDLGTLSLGPEPLMLAGTAHRAHPRFPIQLVLEERQVASTNEWRMLSETRVEPDPSPPVHGSPFQLSLSRMTRGSKHPLRIRAQVFGRPIGPAILIDRDTHVDLDVATLLKGLHPVEAMVRTPFGSEAHCTAVLTRPGASPGPEGPARSATVVHAALADAVDGVARIRWTLVPAGVYELSVALRGITLRTLRDVKIGGPGGDDPRLQQLDLRDVGRTLDVSLGPDTLASLQTPSSALVAVREHTSQISRGSTPSYVGMRFDERGIARLQVGRLPAELWLTAPGHAVLRATVDGPVHTFELPRQHGVHLRLSEATAAQLAGLPVSIELRTQRSANETVRIFERSVQAPWFWRHPYAYQSRIGRATDEFELRVKDHGVHGILVHVGADPRTTLSPLSPLGHYPNSLTPPWALIDTRTQGRGGIPWSIAVPPSTIERKLR